MLIAVLEKAQGYPNLLVSLVAQIRLQRKPLPPLVASCTGIISGYSSTSGVVLSAFLPMVPGLAAGGRRRRPVWQSRPP